MPCVHRFGTIPYWHRRLRPREPYYNNWVYQNMGYGMQLRAYEHLSPPQPTVTNTLITTENPWIPGEPRQFIELNGGCKAISSCYSWMPNGAVAGISVLEGCPSGCFTNQDVKLESVRVRNNRNYGVYLHGIGWTGSSTWGGFFPLPGSANSCVFGNVSTDFFADSTTNNRYKTYSTGTFYNMSSGTAACPTTGAGSY